MSKLLSGNNKTLHNEMMSYWLGMILHLKALIQVNDSKDSVEARAVVVGRLSAIGLAMHQYFGAAIKKMGYEEHQGVMESSLRTYEVAMKYMSRLEEKCNKELS